MHNIMCMCGVAGLYIIIYTRRSRSRHNLYYILLLLYIVVVVPRSNSRVYYRRETGRVHYVTFVYTFVCVCEHTSPLDL